MAIAEKKSSRKELRKFGLVTGVGIAGLFGLLFPLLFGRVLPLWPWITGGILVAAALAVPGLLRPFERVWMAVGAVLGWINTRIILGIIFLLAIVPMGLALRMFGKDPMKRKVDPAAQSYRSPSHQRKIISMERPF
jgi:hypothetical protein